MWMGLCTIDLGSQVLHVASRGLKVPLQSTHKVSHPVDVELVNAVNIPARSELDILHGQDRGACGRSCTFHGYFFSG